MMLPIESVVATMIGETALGRMWRTMIQAPLAPWLCAASTKSRSRRLSAAPRTRRATVVHPNSAMITTIR